MREVQDEAGRAKVRGSMFEVFGMSNPAQDFRIGSPVSQPLLERRLVELEEVEKIAIEANGQIGIVLNLAGMTESNLVDDSFKMGDVSQSGVRTPGYCVLLLWSHESLLHFVQEGQYRIPISDIESVA